MLSGKCIFKPIGLPCNDDAFPYIFPRSNVSFGGLSRCSTIFQLRRRGREIRFVIVVPYIIGFVLGVVQYACALQFNATTFPAPRGRILPHSTTAFPSKTGQSNRSLTHRNLPTTAVMTKSRVQVLKQSSGRRRRRCGRRRRRRRRPRCHVYGIHQPCQPCCHTRCHGNQGRSKGDFRCAGPGRGTWRRSAWLHGVSQ